MVHRSPLEYDVSVAADKRRRARRRGMSGAFEAAARGCDWPGCAAAGQYRAPRAPDRLTEFRWFCLDHVRDYNESWNFFADCSEDDIARILRHAGTWERPTWSLGGGPGGPRGMAGHGDGNAWARFGFADPFEVLGENATINRGPEPAEAVRRRLTGQEEMALETLGLSLRVSERREVRARYRALVKELHPDLNGGTNPEAERLTRVIRAWDVLRKSPRFAD